MRILSIALFALFAACAVAPSSTDDTSAAEVTSVDEADLTVGQSCTPGGTECARDEYCHRPVGMCAAIGTCAKKPAPSQECTDVIVCGCDGNLYSNECAAARAGQSVAAISNCPF